MSTPSPPACLGDSSSRRPLPWLRPAPSAALASGLAPTGPCSPHSPPSPGFAPAQSYLGIGQCEKELMNSAWRQLPRDPGTSIACSHPAVSCKLGPAWTGVKRAVLGVNSCSRRLRGFTRWLQQLPGGQLKPPRTCPVSFDNAQIQCPAEGSAYTLEKVSLLLTPFPLPSGSAALARTTFAQQPLAVGRVRRLPLSLALSGPLCSGPGAGHHHLLPPPLHLHLPWKLFLSLGRYVISAT